MRSSYNRPRLRVYHGMHPHIHQLIRQGFNKTEIRRRLGWTVKQMAAFFATYTGYYRPTKREFYVNDDFFETIDTEAKAYWLGFLYADGCVYHINLTMALQRRDEDHLKTLLKDLDAEYSVHRCDSSYVYKGIEKMRYASSIAISSLKLTHDLIKLGCTSRKTLSLTFPTPNQVPSHLLRHFIRGYFDGDGCIWGAKNKRAGKSLDFVSSDAFIRALCDRLTADVGMERPHIRPHAATEGISYLSYKSYEGIGMMYRYLYADATVYLSRKKIKMEEVVNTQRYEANLVEIPVIKAEYAGKTISCDTLKKRFGFEAPKSGSIFRRMCREGHATRLTNGRPKLYRIL